MADLEPAAWLGWDDDDMPIVIRRADVAAAWNGAELEPVYSRDAIDTKDTQLALQAGEIERLTTELDEAIGSGERQWAGWVAEHVALEAAQAEIARLREALEPFAHGSVDVSGTAVIVGTDARLAHAAARAVLDKGA